MASTYQIIPANAENRTSETIIRTDDNGQIWYIPTDPANSDYQTYLATLAANSATPQA